MTFSFQTTGDWKNTNKFLSKLSNRQIFNKLEKYGQIGVDALSSATPRDSGETAASWYYEIKRDNNSYSIIWGNTNDAGGAPLAVLLQVGHGTGTGGYIQGRDYINPAIAPIFDRIVEEAWNEVTS